jgi:hypothetical protein
MEATFQADGRTFALGGPFLIHRKGLISRVFRDLATLKNTLLLAGSHFLRGT